MRGQLQQISRFADLVGKALTVIETHQTPGARHIVMPRILVQRPGIQILPAALGVGDRLQCAARDARIVRVGIGEIADEIGTFRTHANFFFVQCDLQGSVVRIHREHWRQSGCIRGLRLPRDNDTEQPTAQQCGDQSPLLIPHHF